MRENNVSGILQGMFDKAVEAVMEASELPFNELAESRSEKCVTARVVLVNYLLEQGMSEATIAELSGMSQQRINSLKNASRYKFKASLLARVLRDEVRKLLTSE